MKDTPAISPHHYRPQVASLPSPIIPRAREILAELAKTSEQAVKIDPHAAPQAYGSRARSSVERVV